MRVLYLTFDDLSVPFAWSVHVRAIVNGLAARGHALRVVCPGGRAPGLQAPCDPLPEGKFQHIAGSLATFVRSGKAFAPDVVYIRGIHATVTPVLAAGWLERPLVVEINGLLEYELPPGWRRAVVRAAHRFTLARTARVVTVSPLLKEAIIGKYGFPEDRIDVVPNGVDTDLFRPGDREAARIRLGLPLDRPIVLCVAGFHPHHAIEVLVEASARAKALLVLVGKGGPGSEGVVCAGRVEHEKVPEYVAAADVCAYVLRAPNERFGFSPLKLFEYMAGGRPVAVATDMEDIRAFVEGNRIGRVSTLDGTRFAEALRTLLSDPVERDLMGRRGRDLAESSYTWSRAVARVEEALRKVSR
jgi:glycosyltransferase involved in cell wall biosynthesis